LVSASPEDRLDPERSAELLRAHGIQPTRPRVLIASLLLACPQHRSAEELHGEVNRGSARISKATVYNTLRLFAEKGLVREVLVDRTRVLFDSNLLPHHHLYDVDSGEITDVPADGIRIEGLPDLPEGTCLEDVALVIRVRSRRA
jgi:Fur family iron response transcriptional regulator